MTKGAVIASWAQTGNKRRDLPMAPRHPADDAAAAPRPAAQPGHIGRGRGLVDEHQPSRIETWLRRLPGKPRRGDIRPLLLAGMHDFFKADALGGEKPPHRAVADSLAAVGKLAAKLLQRHVRRLGNPLQQPVPLVLQPRAVVAPHRLGRQPTLIAPRVNPIDDRTHRHPVLPSRPIARQTTLDRRDSPFPQVLRIWSRHPCWPPSPASSLNHNSAPAGIPFPDSSSSDTASRSVSEK